MVEAQRVIKKGVRLRLTNGGETRNIAIPVGTEIPAGELSERKVRALKGKIEPVVESVAPPVVDTDKDKAPVVDTDKDKAPVVDTDKDKAPVVDTDTDKAPVVDTDTDTDKAPVVDTDTDKAPVVGKAKGK